MDSASSEPPQKLCVILFTEFYIFVKQLLWTTSVTAYISNCEGACMFSDSYSNYLTVSANFPY